MKYQLVGINVIEKEGRRYYILHCVSEDLHGRDNFTGKKAEQFFIRENQMPSVKIGDYIIPRYDISGQKAYLLGFDVCK